MVVGRGKMLRTASSVLNKVFIQPDMNKADRQKEKTLVAELKEKRNSDQ